MRDNQALTGHCDDGGGIQKHSAGDIYPCVIRTVVSYDQGKAIAERHEVLYPGRGVVAKSGTYALAERKAKAYLRILRLQDDVDRLLRYGAPA